VEYARGYMTSAVVTVSAIAEDCRSDEEGAVSLRNCSKLHSSMRQRAVIRLVVHPKPMYCRSTSISLHAVITSRTGLVASVAHFRLIY
jgi:hypothetical protein